MAEKILENIAAHPRAGVDRGQDEQRLEQNAEMIPISQRRLAADRARQNMRHADREGRRAARPRQQTVLTHVAGRAGQRRARW